MSQDENEVPPPVSVPINASIAAIGVEATIPQAQLQRFKPSRAAPAVLRGIASVPGTDSQYQALVIERRKKFIEEDPILKVINEGGDAFSILREVKREISREAASLHFDRLEFEKRGKDPTTISARRIEALRRIADIELKIREIDQQAVNLSSEKMQKIFALWVEVMREIAQEVLSPEVMDLFFNRFATAMEGWEERAQDALR